nr:helix-turn-helix domain-containing GNAT family N-acetyltransferase [uncultured Draconibacterium sp.]
MNNYINEIRHFNRFYTSHLGILNNHFLESSYSLTEIRILYEIDEHKNVRAKELCQLLGLNKGYLSRILNRFSKEGIIIKIIPKEDKRTYHINLTANGKKLLNKLHALSNNQIGNFVKQLNDEEKTMLVDSMLTIEDLLSNSYSNQLLAQKVEYRQGLRPGDIGYLIYLHGTLYAKESGYSQDFEGYVAKTFYDFLETYSEEKDRVWLAEYNNRIIGCIAIVHRSESEAQLRWFLVHPVFRGTGIGKKLLNKAINYCRKMKYQNVFLTTTDIQQQAIKMYRKIGFMPTKSVAVEQWGNFFHEERYDLKIKKN